MTQLSSQTSSSTSKKKRKRSKTSGDTDNSKLPTKLLQSLENSDRRASKLRRSEISTDTLPKSKAAQSALNVQTHLMECRILLQKALTSLPALGQCGPGDANGDADGKAVVKKAADRLLLRLLEARKTLCPKQTSNSDDDDSDDDDDGSEKQRYSRLIHTTDTTEPSSSPHRKIETKLGEEYDSLQTTWKSTLDRRHADLRLSSGGAATSDSTRFKVVDRSFWSQVEGTVRHDAALLPAPVCSPVPHPAVAPVDADFDATALPPRPTTPTPPRPPALPPLFDDSKLYRHVLQDFLALSTERHHRGGAGGGGGAAEAAAERLRRAVDKKRRKGRNGDGREVDRRASKGRKIRYVVYPKLAHFTYPVERGAVGMEEDVLFRSMFGGVGGKRRNV